VPKHAAAVGTADSPVSRPRPLRTLDPSRPKSVREVGTAAANPSGDAPAIPPRRAAPKRCSGLALLPVRRFGHLDRPAPP
jgi:hypothetical protein